MKPALFYELLLILDAENRYQVPILNIQKKDILPLAVKAMKNPPCYAGYPVMGKSNCSLFKNDFTFFYDEDCH